MAEQMTRFERIEAVYRMEVSGRVPVAPMICYLIPYLAGLTIREVFTEPEKLVQAFIEWGGIVRDNIDPDLIIVDHPSFLGRAGWDQASLDWRIYDEFTPRGNVPSAMLVNGTPEDVDHSCKLLIEDCAEGGGFILGSECEVPWDSKPENIKAILKAVEKYNPYK